MQSETFHSLQQHLNQQVIGQSALVEQLLVALLADGHILVEGPPGLAKTRAVKSLADCIEGDFHRIQFTPDLLPADLTGTDIFRPETGEFTFQPGPIFNSLVLADEINRAPAKVQSALLEAMQERQVTIGQQSFKLEDPFLVLATQNPIEQEGTYPLPEAQVDRFMLKVKISYPTKSEEQKIMKMNSSQTFPYVNQVITKEDIFKGRQLVNEIYMDEKIEKYILDIIFATRNPEEYGLRDLKDLILYGASPRGSINLALGARAMAFIRRRGYVIPEDVRSICLDVLRHRVAVSYEAEAEEISSETIIQKILNEIEVP